MCPSRTHPTRFSPLCGNPGSRSRLRSPGCSAYSTATRLPSNAGQGRSRRAPPADRAGNRLRPKASTADLLGSPGRPGGPDVDDPARAGGVPPSPDASRYLYPEAFFLLLALGVLVGSLKIPAWSMWAASAVLLVSLWPNIDRLHDAGQQFSRDSERYRVQYSALEIAGPSARPGFRPVPFSPDAAGYLAAVRAFGSGRLHCR